MPSRSAMAGLSTRVRESARTAARSAGLYTGVSALGALLAQHRGASLAAQVFAAEWGAGRLGVSWSDPAAPIPRTGDVLARLGKGAAIGAASAVAVLVGASAAGALRLGPARPAFLDLGVGLLVALFTAARDELLLRGVVLATFRHTMSDRGRLLVAGAVAVAAHVSQTPDEPVRTMFTTTGGIVSLVTAFFVGLCFTSLWLRDRGAFLPCGAHAAWTLVTTTVLSGGLWTASWHDGLWGGGGLETSLAFAIGVGLLAGFAVLATARSGLASRP